MTVRPADRLTPANVPAVPSPPPFTLDDLYAYFPDRSDRPAIQRVAATDVPEPYHRLLVHSHHMTVTVEQFYGDAVDVKVLEARREGNSYARKILLALRGSGRIVQFGIVHVDLGLLAPAVRDEIVSQRTPLGRVLIQHNVLRVVRPIEFFRAMPGPAMCGWFDLAAAEPIYGRLGVIFTDGKPAIRVAEILTPIH